MKDTWAPARFESFAIVVSLAVLAFSILSSLSAGASDEKEIVLETRIATATVYSDRAQVTRTGTVELKAGLYKLICGDLPRSFDESSLRVEGTGTARSRIMGVDVVKVQGLAAESPRYKELKGKLEKLTARRDTLRMEQGALMSSAEFLDNYAKFPFEKGSAKLATEIFRVQDWKSVIAFIHSERMRMSVKGDDILQAHRQARRGDQLDRRPAQRDANEGRLESPRRHRLRDRLAGDPRARARLQRPRSAVGARIPDPLRYGEGVDRSRV